MATSTASKLPSFEIRSSPTIRENFLRDIRNGFARQDIDANVTPGSDWYILAQAVANQLEPAEANAVVKVASVMPDEAEGPDLERIGAQFEVIKGAAAGSTGPVIFNTTATSPTAISAGEKLIDGAGLSFETVSSGSYSNGDSITISAIDTGAQTNHEEGDVLRWVSKPVGANEKVLVGVGGLVNGIDADDDEVLRARLFAKLQVPPGSGNSQHVAEIAEASSANVQKAFVVAAPQGAGSVHVAVTAAPTATSKSRVVATTTMTGTVSPYILSEIPQPVQTTITTVTDVSTDVAFGLMLPEAPTAAPSGPGGGWKDGTPWPAPDASTTWKCSVTSVTSSLVFTVDAATEPTSGVSRICWVDQTSWSVKEATVLSYTGSTGAYVITIDTPFTSIATGHFIWPSCVNAQSYLDAVLDAYALMGPGEKTANPSLLIRSHRHPRPGASWPYSLGGNLTKAITYNAPNEEVASAQFFYRTDGTTTLTGSSGLVTPQVPGTITNPPNIFIPRNIGFYRVP